MSQSLGATEHEVAVGGVTLHVATWGTRTDPSRTVLLIHGITASHKSWAQLGPALAAQGWYVIAPDLRGRGLSGKPAHGYGIPFHADDLQSLLDALHLPSIHIVGHSLGAIIGYYMAALHPERVGKLVLVDGGGKIPDDTAQTIGASLARLGTRYPSLDAYLEAMSHLPVLTWNDFWAEYFRYDAEVHPDGTASSRVPRAAIMEEYAVLDTTRTEDLAPLVRAPTLILRAALGTLGPDRGFILPRDEAERLATVIPDCQLIEIAETNHYTITLSPQLEEAVASFLAE